MFVYKVIKGLGLLAVLIVLLYCIDYVDCIDNITSANEADFEIFVCKINELVDECFLIDEKMQQSKRNRIKNPWITFGIIVSIKKKELFTKIGLNLPKN